MEVLLTKDALGIFWHGEEVDGCTAYGYWAREDASEPLLPKGIWPDGTEYKSTRLYGPMWCVWCWDIRILQWPEQDQWTDVISSTLRAIRNSGAEVAWFGLDEIFADPPSLFSPKRMSGGVWAALGREDIQYGPPVLHGEFAVLADSDLIELRKEAGLAVP